MGGVQSPELTLRAWADSQVSASIRDRKVTGAGYRSPSGPRYRARYRPLGNGEISPNVRFSCLRAISVPQTAIGRP